MLGPRVLTTARKNYEHEKSFSRDYQALERSRRLSITESDFLEYQLSCLHVRPARISTAGLKVMGSIPDELIDFETRFLQERHGVTSQKTAFFIVTAVKPKILHYGNLLKFVNHFEFWLKLDEKTEY
jgi:hypothetical protein